MTEAKKQKKKKKKFSLARVIIGVAVMSVIVYGLVLVEDGFANAPYHRDLFSYFTPDGQSVVFVRWHPWINGTRDGFEIWKTGADGGEAHRIYTSGNGFNVYGIRRFKFSSDGRYINLRLNRRDQLDGTMKDKLVKIDLNGKEKPVEWLLEKKYPYDVFLAFHNDRVIYRKMRDKGKFPDSDLYEVSFTDRKEIRHLEFTNGTMCIMAEYFGPENKLLGQIKVKNTKDPDNWIFKTYDFESGASHVLDHPANGLRFLSKQKALLGIDLENTGDFYIFDLDGTQKLAIKNPENNGCSQNFSIAPDEKSIAIPGSGGFWLLNIENCRPTPVKLDGILDSPISFSPDGKKVTYSDGNVIYTADLDGKNAKTLTDISERSRYLKDENYRKYLNTRNRIVFGTH